MSNTPFSDSTSSTADVVTAVDFAGTTLTLTKQAGDDLTTTISSSPQIVTGMTYNAEGDDKLKLTQSAGQGSFEVTIPSGGGAKAAWFAHDDAYMSVALNAAFDFNTAPINIGSGYSTSTGKFTCPAGCAGKYVLIFNLIVRASSLNRTIEMAANFQKTASGSSTEVTQGGIHAVNPYDINSSVSSSKRWLTINATCIVDLAEGDSVWVKNVSVNNNSVSYNIVTNVDALDYKKTNFSGFWISE